MGARVCGFRDQSPGQDTYHARSEGTRVARPMWLSRKTLGGSRGRLCLQQPGTVMATSSSPEPGGGRAESLLGPHTGLWTFRSAAVLCPLRPEQGSPEGGPRAWQDGPVPCPVGARGGHTERWAPEGPAGLTLGAHTHARASTRVLGKAGRWGTYL